jgi:hypothetical protein
MSKSFSFTVASFPADMFAVSPTVIEGRCIIWYNVKVKIRDGHLSLL